MKNIITKKLTRMMIDKAIESLQEQRNKPADKEIFLDVLNSGIYVDLNKVKEKAYDIAIKAIKAAKVKMEKT